MTALEWRTCKDVRRMIRHLDSAMSRRQADAWRIACCENAWETLSTRDREVVIAAAEHWLGTGAQRPDINVFFPVFMSVMQAPNANNATHAQFLRDIVGNPFRPVSFSPTWRTPTAVALAQGMYDSRDFSAMPILADALQDAGCDSNVILAHCRDPHATHVRGCWVVDLVLGKV
jgi:hypothetical protein